jgi:hypothetical protein
MTQPKPNQRDVDILRRMAQRKIEIAQDPVNLERKRLWYALDGGTGGRPMVLAEVGGVMKEALPDTTLQCTDEWARGIERVLRAEIYQFEVLKDDHVIEPFMPAYWEMNVSSYGVEPVQHRPDNAGRLGARRWDPPIKDLDKDLDRMHPRTYSVDRQGTLATQAAMESVFGSILPVRIQGSFWWSLGMTNTAIDLIGLENLMLFMYDNPAGLHRLMNLLCEDYLAYAKWLEGERLLTLNNGNHYTGSGSIGYTLDLPARDWKVGMPVRTQDLWALLESQETVGVGPDLFEEFIFGYQLKIAKCFGKIYYGCCEPVHTRIQVLKKLPNMARVSVSPWADENAMARECGRQIVFSRKPNPAIISTENFDEAAIRADVGRTLDAAKGCRLEIIMKDVHTLNNEPQRLARWVQIAMEEIDRRA